MCSSFILCDVMQSQFGLQLYNGLHLSNAPMYRMLNGMHMNQIEQYVKCESQKQCEFIVTKKGDFSNGLRLIRLVMLIECFKLFGRLD